MRKNECLSARGCTDITRTIYRAMKIFTFIMLVGCLHVYAGSEAQTISLSEKNAPLQQVFKKIQKQTGYEFFYPESLLRNAGNVTVKVTNGTIEQVVRLCLEGKDLDFTIMEKTVIIKEKEKKTLEIEKAPPITGIVRGPDGEPLQGVNVVIKGRTKGTVTDNEGRFTIEVNENDVLLISSIGFGSREVKVTSLSTPLVVGLDKRVSELDEVQYIAYGKTSQRLGTGNVTTIKGADIEKQPVQNPLLALQGRVPGLFITQTTGIANGNVSVRVQGQNSLRTQANEPLIIIDGVPYPSVLPSDINGSPISGTDATLGASPLSFINPLNIEAVSVLKDADATSIYGSRAANGAILITTKKGKAGKTRTDINLQHGWGKVTRSVKMMNTRQYLDMRYEALQNDGIDINSLTPTSSRYFDLKVWDTSRYTDWQKFLIGNSAQYSTINASVTGGNSSMQYLVGGTYNRTTDVFPGDFDDQRGAINFNLNGSSADHKFKMQLSGSYMIDENTLPGIDMTEKSLLYEPVAPAIYQDDGSLNWAPNSEGISTWTNPIIYSKYSRYVHTSFNMISSLQLNYEILNGLNIRANFGYSNLQTNALLKTPLEVNKPEDRPFSIRSADQNFRTVRTWIIEPQAIYERAIGNMKLDFLVGVTIQKNVSEFITMHGEGFSSDLAMNNVTSAPSSTVGLSNVIYRYNAGFTRLNLNWNDRYVLSLNARRDGSSRFGEINRFHSFGSIGAGWILSKENFMSGLASIISFAKLRGSYGTTGHDQIGDYTFLSLYRPFTSGIPYQGMSSFRPLGISNPYLEWEETRKWQGGLDLGFWKDKLIFNITYGLNKSSNQLISYSIPGITGFPSVGENFPATVRNTSWEFITTYNIIDKKNLSWTFGLNMTVPENKVISFPNIEKTNFSSGNNGVIVGQPLGVSKLYHYMGVDPTSGLYLVADEHGNPTSTPSFSKNRTALISLLPKFYGGIQNSIVYKSFQLDFLFQFVRQLGPKSLHYFNGSVAPGYFSRFNRSNQPIAVLDRWRKPGDNATIARFNYDNSLVPWVDQSDAAYSFDASFMRLKNVSMTWQVPNKMTDKIGLRSSSIYFQGQNLLTLTDYTGLDPENLSFTSLPPLQLWTMGIKIGL